MCSTEADGHQGGGHAIDALAALAIRAGRGDQLALAELHARFDRPLRGFFHKRGAGSEANIDDLVQLTWMEVWKSLSTGRYDPERAAISTFVYAVATNVWLRHRRSAGRNRRAGGLEETEPSLPGETDPAVAAPSAELLESVRRVLRSEVLTEQERQIVTASASGASDRELAARLGVAPSTVNARKQSGLDKVRRALARMGFRSESAEREGGSGE